MDAFGCPMSAKVFGDRVTKLYAVSIWMNTLRLPIKISSTKQSNKR